MGQIHLKIAPNSSKHMCTNFSCYDHIHVRNNQLHKRPLWKKYIHTSFVNTVFWFDVFPDLFIFDRVMPKLKQETPPQINLWESSFCLKLTKGSMESERFQTLYPTCRTVCQSNSKEASKKTMKTYMFPKNRFVQIVHQWCLDWFCCLFLQWTYSCSNTVIIMKHNSPTPGNTLQTSTAQNWPKRLVLKQRCKLA